MLDRQIEIKQKQLQFNKHQIVKNARDPEPVSDAIINREVDKIRNTIKNAQGYESSWLSLKPCSRRSCWKSPIQMLTSRHWRIWSRSGDPKRCQVRRADNWWSILQSGTGAEILAATIVGSTERDKILDEVELTPLGQATKQAQHPH